MRFTYPIDFEIADEWLKAAGMEGFQPQANSYVASAIASGQVLMIPISEVEPPQRNLGVETFGRDRMISILRGIREGHSMPPIKAHELPIQTKYRYALLEGFHRFYASVAAGLSCVPAQVLPYFDPGQRS